MITGIVIKTKEDKIAIYNADLRVIWFYEDIINESWINSIIYFNPEAAIRSEKIEE